MVTVVTERDVMSDVQRIETEVLCILVGVNMRTTALVSIGTVRFASHDNIIDGHDDSLFDERQSSIKSTRYRRVVKLVQKEETIYY